MLDKGHDSAVEGVVSGAFARCAALCDGRCCGGARVCCSSECVVANFCIVGFDCIKVCWGAFMLLNVDDVRSCGGCAEPSE